jgi:hypothetical protein
MEQDHSSVPAKEMNISGRKVMNSERLLQECAWSLGHIQNSILHWLRRVAQILHSGNTMYLQVAGLMQKKKWQGHHGVRKGQQSLPRTMLLPLFQGQFWVLGGDDGNCYPACLPHPIDGVQMPTHDTKPLHTWSRDNRIQTKFKDHKFVPDNKESVEGGAHAQGSD